MVNIFLKEITPILLKREKIEYKDFLCTLVFGSWNYGLNTSESDMDLIIITKNKNKKVTQEVLGQVQFLSIKQFVNYLNKRAPKYWEALLSKYCYINSIYQSSWLKFQEKMIAQINHKDFLYTLKNKISEHLDYLLWIPMPTKAKEYYHQKRMYMLLRVREQYENIKAGMSFQDSLIHQNNFYSNLVEIKTIPNYLSPEQVNNIIKDFRHFLITENPPKKIENPKEQEIIDNFLAQINLL